MFTPPLTVADDFGAKVTDLVMATATLPPEHGR